jgi:hypothetical protein
MQWTPDFLDAQEKNFNCAALAAASNLTTGALVMTSLSIVLVAPPDVEIALQPLFVLATRQPSVVAIGTCNSNPSSRRGPATPIGSYT